MRSLHLLLVPALLLVLVFPVTRGRYNDDFDDGEDLADFDDNDFAEFEDNNEDPVAEAETAPPPRVSHSSQPEEEEDEDEATVELEDGQDGFEDSETQVCLCVTFDILKKIIYLCAECIILHFNLKSEGPFCTFTVLLQHLREGLRMTDFCCFIFVINTRLFHVSIVCVVVFVFFFLLLLEVFQVLRLFH